MQKRDPCKEKVFIKYFLTTYIPPFTTAMATSEAIFKDSYLSALTVWDGFEKTMASYAFSDRLKSKLQKLFALWSALWESYLCVTTDELQMGDHAFCAWTRDVEIQRRWKEIQALALNIDRSGKTLYNPKASSTAREMK